MEESLFDPKKLLPEFDNFLHKKGVKFSAVVIGSGALTIMGFLQRQTVDWVKDQEAHPSWPDHVDSKIKELFRGLAYES